MKLRWSRIRENDGSGRNANVPWWTTKPKTSWNDFSVLLHVQGICLGLLRRWLLPSLLRLHLWVYSRMPHPQKFETISPLCDLHPNYTGKPRTPSCSAGSLAHQRLVRIHGHRPRHGAGGGPAVGGFFFIRFYNGLIFSRFQRDSQRHSPEPSHDYFPLHGNQEL